MHGGAGMHLKTSMEALEESIHVSSASPFSMMMHGGMRPPRLSLKPHSSPSRMLCSCGRNLPSGWLVSSYSAFSCLNAPVATCLVHACVGIATQHSGRRTKATTKAPRHTCQRSSRAGGCAGGGATFGEEELDGVLHYAACGAGVLHHLQHCLPYIPPAPIISVI